MAWRRLLILPLALLACLAVVMLARMLAQAPDIEARWDVDVNGRLQLISAEQPELLAVAGHSLVAIAAPGSAPLLIEGRRVNASIRWLASDAQRAALTAQQRLTMQALQPERSVNLIFADGSSVSATPHARGYASLGITFWLLCGLALALVLVGAVVVLVRPDMRNLLYAAMAQSQALQLALAAADAVPGLNHALLLAGHEAPVRMMLDVITCAALLHATMLYPTPLPRRRLLTVLTWFGAAWFCAALLRFEIMEAWWWTQALVLGGGLLVIALLG